MTVAADFTAAAANCREALRAGTRLTGQQIQQILACLEANDGVALHTDIATLNTDYTAQMAILSAFTGASAAADIVAAIATAKALLDPEVAACVTKTPVNVTITADTKADGLPLAGTY